MDHTTGWVEEEEEEDDDENLAGNNRVKSNSARLREINSAAEQAMTEKKSKGLGFDKRK